MPTGYIVEVSKNARAICKNKECKDAGVKIQKGKVRFGTLVTIHEHTSWAYKHWGCVTPAQIEHLIEFTNGETDLVDGYDDLPSEIQEKVKFALANGHVPDEDWKGDVQVNRPGQKGFRAKAQTPKKKKKGKKAAENDSPTDEESKPKAKRGRAVEDDDSEVDAPPQKKAKGRGKKASTKQGNGEDDAIKGEDEAEQDEPEPTKVKGRGKKAAVKVEDVEAEDEMEHDKPEPKKSRGKKVTVKRGDEPKPTGVRARRNTAKTPRYNDDATDPEDEANSDAEAEPPKPKRSRKKVAVADDENPAPQKRSRKKKATAEEV
ncbi:zf-PARP-domain-containing protein [Melanomma pulvis-pyrius CBS 109.77]|uniref:Zf-PARP-domain-containing protein n=1 Tax=Melanomma pulvis-pyrius CBS 109.77 TaxID=1314802 RepID=A0A6A6WU26_9PLEO|nr:zf-PARP-domain-containing protein [Melanomma pulvis-pyrius CBS 109.77]